MKIDHLVIRDKNLSSTLTKGRSLFLATAASLALTGCSLGERKQEVQDNVITMEASSMLDELENADTIHVSSEDISNLHLTLCNNCCNSEIFNSTVQKIRDLGVYVDVAFPGDDILNRENSTVITMAGGIYDSENSVLLGQYNNNLMNNSDTLALAMNTSFKVHGLTVDGIRPGVATIDTETTIPTRVPTATEKNLAPGSSFVAIALGNKIDPRDFENVSDAIVDGIIRATHEIKENPNADYLYRTSFNDTIDAMAIHMGVLSEELVSANKNLQADFVPINETIRNPSFYRSEAFRADTPFAVGTSKSK